MGGPHVTLAPKTDVTWTDWKPKPGCSLPELAFVRLEDYNNIRLSKMPKKGENSKAVEARARKEEKKQDEKEKKKKVEEDAYWEDNDKMVLKKQSRQQQREASATEKAAHKASLKTAYEEDMAAAASVTTSAKNATAKLTRAEMQRRIDDEAKKEQEARKAAATPSTVPEEPLTENLNRLQVEDSARSVGDAIQVLSDKPAKQDKHPEKRLQAAYKAFEDRMMPQVKEENKNMRLSQWKQIIWKEWTKSPENPLNQAKLQRQNEELS